MTILLFILALLIDLAGLCAGTMLVIDGPQTGLAFAMGGAIALVFASLAGLLVYAFIRRRHGLQAPFVNIFRALAFLPAVIALVGSFDLGRISGQEMALVLAVAAVGWLNMRAFRAPPFS